MRRTPVIPQIECPHTIPRRQIRPRRLPVSRRTKQPVKNHQWRIAGTAQITMKKLNHADQ